MIYKKCSTFLLYALVFHASIRETDGQYLTTPTFQSITPCRSVNAFHDTFHFLYSANMKVMLVSKIATLLTTKRPASRMVTNAPRNVSALKRLVHRIFFFKYELSFLKLFIYWKNQDIHDISRKYFFIRLYLTNKYYKPSYK